MITEWLLHCDSFLILNSFLTKNILSVSTSLKIYNPTQIDFVRYIRVHYNEGLLLFIIMALQPFVGPWPLF
jgi:hypothetical protein